MGLTAARTRMREKKGMQIPRYVEYHVTKEEKLYSSRILHVVLSNLSIAIAAKRKVRARLVGRTGPKCDL